MMFLNKNQSEDKITTKIKGGNNAKDFRFYLFLIRMITEIFRIILIVSTLYAFFLEADPA